MKAVVYRAPGQVEVTDIAEPTLGGPRDALVRVRASAICGSDLHIYHGHIPMIYDGMPMGHEYLGEVVSVGPDVTSVRPGDVVAGSFTLACGSCAACSAGRFNFCESGRGYGFGPLFGDCGGTQGELVRVQDADVNLLAKPDGVADDDFLLIGDIMSTAWYATARGGVKAGDTVLVVGAGPVGILSAMAAFARGASRVVLADVVQERLDFGASVTGAETCLSGADGLAAAWGALSDRGADVVVESVGMPGAFIDAISCARDGGTVSVIGVHAEPTLELPIGDAFRRGLSLVLCGPSNVQGVWHDVLTQIQAGRLTPSKVISHRMKLADAAEGYRLFADKKATKIVIDIG